MIKSIKSRDVAILLILASLVLGFSTTIPNPLSQLVYKENGIDGQMPDRLRSCRPTWKNK